MEHNGQLRRSFRLICGACNWALLSAVYAYVWIEVYADFIFNPFFRKGHWLVVALYAFLLIIFTKIYGGYKVGDMRIAEMVYSHGLAIFIVNVVTYVQISLLSLKLVNPTGLLLLAAVQLVIVIIWATVCNRLFYDLFPPRKLLLIRGSDATDDIRSKLAQRPDKYNVTEEIDIAEGYGRVCERITDYSSVILCDVQSPERNDILKYCYERSIRTYITPKISDIILRGAEPIQLFDTPLLVNKNRGISYEQRITKRAMDIVISGIALLLLSPVYAVVAIAIKREDGGPVLYKQRRLTIDGKVFELCKFRSMIVDAEKDGVARLASVGDSRITRVGKVIRSMRLDELPQLINIFRGEMSVVGPRPERPEISEDYCRTMPEFAYRLKLKAGLTGYAQVVGKYNTTAYDKLKLDLMYIQNYSLLMDLRIIFMTVKILFMKESTEGIAEGAKTPKHRSAGDDKVNS